MPKALILQKYARLRSRGPVETSPGSSFLRLWKFRNFVEAIAFRRSTCVLSYSCCNIRTALGNLSPSPHGARGQPAGHPGERTEKTPHVRRLGQNVTTRLEKVDKIDVAPGVCKTKTESPEASNSLLKAGVPRCLQQSQGRDDYF